MPYMLVCDDGDGHEYHLGPFASIEAVDDQIQELRDAAEGYFVRRIDEVQDGGQR